MAKDVVPDCFVPYKEKTIYEPRGIVSNVTGNGSNRDSDNHPVYAPSHYVEGRNYEPRKVISDWKLNFNLGNALKYISRCERKGNKIEDLRKAIQYLEFEIEDTLGSEQLPPREKQGS